MPLRYSFIYFYDEQNWNKKISLNKHDIVNNLLARRFKSNQVERHNITFENRDKPKIENFFNFDDSNTAQNNENDAVCDKKEFTRITQKKFYRY